MSHYRVAKIKKTKEEIFQENKETLNSLFKKQIHQLKEEKQKINIDYQIEIESLIQKNKEEVEQIVYGYSLHSGQDSFSSFRNEIQSKYLECLQKIEKVKMESKEKEEKVNNKIFSITKATYSLLKEVYKKYPEQKDFIIKEAENIYKINSLKEQEVKLGILEKLVEQKIEEYQLKNKEHLSYIQSIIDRLNTAQKENKILEKYNKDLTSIKEIFYRLLKIESLKDREENFILVKTELDHFEELQNFIQKINPIRSIEKIYIPVTKTKDTKNQIELWKKDIEKFYQFIQLNTDGLDKELESLYIEVQKEFSEQRIGIIRDSFLLKYSQLKENISWSNVYKNSLLELKKELEEEKSKRVSIEDIYDFLYKEIDLNLSQRIVSKNNYTSIQNKLRELKKENESPLKTIQESLLKIGYLLVDEKDTRLLQKLARNEKVILDTKHKNYKVLCKWNESGELITRLIRFVKNEDEKNHPTSYQKQKDKEVAEEWCKEYQLFLDKLKEEGLPSEILNSQQPEEDVMILLDNSNILSSNSAEIQVKTK